MSIWTSIVGWFHSQVDKAGALINKLWIIAKPFLEQVLSQTASNALSSLQALAIAAVSQIASQGLPTNDAQRKAFEDYMKAQTQAQGIILKDSELNLLRETALAIFKASQK